MNNNGSMNNPEYIFNTIEEAIKDLQAGKMVIVVDDPDRENEGDIIMAAELVRPEDVNFITREARGILCLTITREKAEKLDLDFMVENNTALHQTPFSVSIDYKYNTTTEYSRYTCFQTNIGNTLGYFRSYIFKMRSTAANYSTKTYYCIILRSLSHLFCY